MKHTTVLFLSVLILCTVLVIGGCISSGPSIRPDIPELDIEADFITVGFEDNSTMNLTKGSPEFTEINNEAIKIYQNISVAAECVISPEESEEIKYNNKFVEIEFIEPVSITTYTDEGGVYRILDLTSAIFVLTGEYSGHVLNKGQASEESPDWGCFFTRQSPDNLESMVDAVA